MGTKQKTKTQKQYAQKLGQMEVRDYEKNMFNPEAFGGEAEAEALIKRYSKKTNITDDDRRILLNNVPLPPRFQVLSKEQYEGKGCWKKSRYKKKVKNYFEEREKYYKKEGKAGKDKKKRLTPGQVFALKRQEIESRFSAEESESVIQETSATENIQEKENITDTTDNNTSIKEPQKVSKKLESGKDLSTTDKEAQLEQELDELISQKQNEFKSEEFFDEIYESPYSMDTAYQERRDNPKYSEAEFEIGKKELEYASAKNRVLITNLKLYSALQSGMINRRLRNNGEHLMDATHKMTIAAMRAHPIKRDIIVRRGVTNVKALGFMLGINAEKMPEEELKKLLKERKESGEPMIAVEKGYMSTALPDATKHFDARGNIDSIGVEFIILVKKGTPALNISSISSFREESEVVLAPNTKFKVVDMQLDGDAEIYHGDPKSWKVYLTTIPQSEEGILKE